MNAMTNINDVEIRTVPLSECYLSPLNPRQHTDPDSDRQLANSILACGLMQNLSAFIDEEGRYGIVAGGRRLRALQIAVTVNPSLSMVPVRVAPDEVTAALWAGTENSAREALSPADEIRCFAQSIDRGASVAEIAVSFVVTEAHVKRRLKLASLPPFVLDALARGDITLDIATAFTVSNDPVLAEEVLNWALTTSSYYLTADNVRRKLQPVAVTLNDTRARFIGVEAYEAAGGPMMRDLFSDDVFFEDPALLDRLVAEKLQDAAEAKRVAGSWLWAEVRDKFSAYDKQDMAGLTRMRPVPKELEPAEEEEFAALDRIARPWNYADDYGGDEDYDEEEDEADDDRDIDEEIPFEEGTEEEDEEQGELTEAQAARLEELSAKKVAKFSSEQRAVGGIIVTLGWRGEVEVLEGLLRAEDGAVAAETGAVAPEMLPSPTPAPQEQKKAFSAGLVEDLHSVQLAAVQTALLKKPDLVLDLLAFALANTSIRTQIIGITADKPRNQPGITEGLTFDPRLAHVAKSWSGKIGGTDAFLDFEAQPKKDRTGVLVEGIARTLHRESSLFDLIAERTGASIRAVWTPNAVNFFSRVPASYMIDLLKSLLDASDGDERITAFSKLKKGEKATAMEKLFSGDVTHRKLTGVTAAQAKRIDNWFPSEDL